MTDPDSSALAEIKVAGLRPRRYRIPAILIRRLIWPALRAWFYGVVQNTSRLQAELEQMRQQAQADRIAAARALRQVDTLQATLAAFTIDRAFFENTIRTELMAIANVVDCYREIVEDGLATPSLAMTSHSPTRV